MFVFTRFEQPNLAKFGYLVFASLVALSFFSRQLIYKKIAASLSLLSLLIVGCFFPLDIEVIEEIYLFVPLLYIVTFPGSLYPILAAVLLLSAYLPSFEQALLGDILEDGAELVVITCFASIMTFFQQKSRKQMERFRKESYTDYLTGLANRKSFLKTIEQCVATCAQHKKKQFALLIVDLDGFKNVNDRYGHVVGDSALQLVSKRFSTLATEDYGVFRTGGDEFAFICFPKENIKPYATSLAKQIIAQSKSRYVFKEKKYTLTASIGISLFPLDTDDPETLFSYTDLAMYKSKSIGKNTYCYFDSSLSDNAFRRFTLESDLKNAIKNQQLSLHYQPKVCSKKGVVVSAEALIRWFHPTLGLISPAEFIPIAEQTGQIVTIGNWVIEQASKQAVKWCQHADFANVAVNVSAIQLAQEEFIEQTLVTLKKTGCSPSYIEIEQTESALMDNMQDNIEVLKRLKQAGFTLSLDDFGTAYSSLSQLSQLPIDILKIDKSFVDNCATCEKAHMVVKTIIQLATNLNMRTIAEGVEDKEQLAILNSEGCFMYQGYFYSKPLPVEEFEKLLAQQISNILT